ncbi:MAG: metallophosphoesterase [Phycisphaerales bacterium]|nr:MAG: metallophosphoesterase [Phycisphaerales bacterium]
MQNAEAVCGLLEQAAEAMLSADNRRGSVVRLPARGRLIVTGDLHDNPFHLRKLLRLAKLDTSPDHHLILQEMIHGERLLNGMDFSHRMLIKGAQLVCEYPHQVHPLLANHELSQMTGVGVSKGAGNSVDLFNDALQFVYGDRCEEVAEAINAFVRAMPLALISEGGVFCAHSLPAERMMRHFDETVFDRELTDEDYRKPHGAAHLLVWGRDYSQDQVAKLAEARNVKLFCLGHEHAEMGLEMRMPQVLVLNTDHERAAALPLDLAAVPEAEEALPGAIPLNALPEGEERGDG